MNTNVLNLSSLFGIFHLKSMVVKEINKAKNIKDEVRIFPGHPIRLNIIVNGKEENKKIRMRERNSLFVVSSL